MQVDISAPRSNSGLRNLLQFTNKKCGFSNIYIIGINQCVLGAAVWEAWVARNHMHKMIGRGQVMIHW